LQQEIAEASDDATRKYYDETPKEDKSDEGVTAAMRSAAKSKQQSFKGQFSKYLATANPKFGDKFLDVCYKDISPENNQETMHKIIIPSKMTAHLIAQDDQYSYAPFNMENEIHVPY
jgi:hypothetical protein